jgi:hypothetical protein
MGPATVTRMQRSVDPVFPEISIGQRRLELFEKGSGTQTATHKDSLAMGLKDDITGAAHSSFSAAKTEIPLLHRPWNALVTAHRLDELMNLPALWCCDGQCGFRLVEKALYSCRMLSILLFCDLHAKQLTRSISLNHSKMAL